MKSAAASIPAGNRSISGRNGMVKRRVNLDLVWSDLSRAQRATSPPSRPCSSRMATGATSSPSAGTSTPPRAGPASGPSREATLDRTGPTALAIEGEATEANGIVEAGSPSRPPPRAARAMSACADELCWTLLTSLEELKGFEEKKGRHRASASLHGIHRDRKYLAGAAGRTRKPSSGSKRQPYCVVVGGGQGGIALGARLRQLGVPTIILEAQRAPGRLLAQALQVALPARPGLVRPPALPAVPRRTGRCSRPRTRSATGWRCTRR